MASLDLGVLVGRAMLDTSEFDAAYARTTGKMRAFGGEASKAAAGTSKLDESLAATAGSADKASAATGKAGQSATRLSAAQERAAAAAKAQADAMARVGAVLAEVSGESAKVQQATLRQLAANQRLAASEAEAGSAAARQATETARLASAQASAIGASRSLATAQKESTGLWGKYGAGIMRTAGELGLIVGAFEAVKAAIDITKQAASYQRSMTQIQTLTGASAGEIKTMSSALLGLSGKVAQAPEDLAVALYHAESVGLRGAKAFNAVEVAAKAAGVGGASLEDTMNALTSTVASGIGKNQSYAKTMSQLLTIVGSGDMTLQQFNDSLSTGGLAIMAQYGLSLKDVGAALAVFGDQNIRGAKAMTYLRMAVQGMAVPMKSAGSTLDDLHMTTSTLANDMQKGGLLKALTDLKQRMDAAGISGKEMGQTLTELVGKRGGAGLSVLMSKMNDSVGNVLSKYKAMEDATQSLGSRWATFTQTASFQFKSLGDSITAAGIAALSHLTPALGGIASVLTGAVKGAIAVVSNALAPFIAAWHVVSSIITPVAHALSGMGSALAPVAHALEGVGGAALAMWAAFKGYTIVSAAIKGIGDLFGAIVAKATAAAIAAQDAGAAIAAGGAEARVGWAGILGPLALVAVGVTALITAFHSSSSASKEAAAAAKAYTDALQGDGQGTVVDSIIKQLSDNNVPQLLDSLNKALGHTEYTGTQFVSAIQKGGDALDGLRARLKATIAAGTYTTSRGQGSYAIEITKMTPAAQAASTALEHLNAQYSGMTTAQAKELAALREFKQAATPIQNVAKTLHLASDAAKQYATMAGLAVTSNDNVIGASDKTKAAIARVASAYRTASASGQTFLDALKNFSGTAGTAADRAALIGSTLVAANGDALNFAAQMNSAAAATKQLGSDMRQAAKSVGKNGETTKAFLRSIVNLKTGTIEYRKSAAAPLIGDLQSMQSAAMSAASATFQHARATMSAKNAADAAYKVYKSQTSGALVDEATKLGLTAGQAHKLAAEYFGMPKRVKTLIEQEGGDPVVAVLNKIGRLLAFLVGKPWNPKITADNRDAMSKAQQVQSKLNILKGMQVNPTVSLNTGSVLAQIAYVQNQLNSIQGPTVTVHVLGANGQLSQGRAVTTQAVGTQAAFGRKTIPPNTAFTVGERGWEGGVTDAQGRASIFSHGDSIKMGFRAPVGYANGTGPSGVAKSDGITKAKDHGKTVWMYAGHRYDSVQAAENALASDERQAAQKRRQAGHQLPGDYRGVFGGLSSISAMRAAMRQLINDMRDAGAGKSFLAKLRDDAKAFGTEIRQRDADIKQLGKDITKLHNIRQALGQEKSTIRSAVTGAFDITTAGQGQNGGPVTLGAMRAQEAQAKVMIGRYSKAIGTLEHRYGKTPTGAAWVRQLASAGLSDYGEVMALANGPRRLVAGMVHTQEQINQMAGGLARRIGLHDHGAQLRHAEHQVATDRRAVRIDKRDLDHLVIELGHQVEYIAEHLKIDMNGRQVGRVVTTAQNQMKHLHPRSGRRG